MLYRQAGPIPTINSEKIPTRIVIFDTEANRSEPINGIEFQSLRLGSARYIQLDREGKIEASDWFDFHTVEELGSWLLYLARKDRALYVYAHNLKYDLQLSGLLTWLIGEGFTPGLFVMEDPPTFMRLKSGRKSFMFVDTFNYWQYGVAAMGEQLEDKKLIMPEGVAGDSDWFTYCRRDVEILSEYLLSFIRFLLDNDLAPMGLTLASSAFRAYRHRFMRAPIILHNRKEVLALERDSYYGGRTEAFYIGEAPAQDYYKLDVNSMYPYVMREYKYPVELVGYSEGLDKKRLESLLGEYYCIADIELDTATPLYPYVRKHKLIFPTGRYRANLHQAELERAVEEGSIVRVHRIAIYREEDIFSSYVAFFYELKLKADREHDPIIRKMAKIFLNSLYGKFGQREIISKIAPNPGEPEYKRITGYSESLGTNVEVNYLGDMIELRYKGGESFYSFPAIAGAVTSRARVFLWKLIERSGLENVLYTDTDSIITNYGGYSSLIPYLSSDELGALKLEGKSQILTIRGCKDYRFGEETHIKGVPKSARELEPGLWEYEQFRGAKTWLKQGLPSGVEVYTKLKSRRGIYDKGEILSSGRVTAWRLSGDTQR